MSAVPIAISVETSLNRPIPGRAVIERYIQRVLGAARTVAQGNSVGPRPRSAVGCMQTRFILILSTRTGTYVRTGTESRGFV